MIFGIASPTTDMHHFLEDCNRREWWIVPRSRFIFHFSRKKSYTHCVAFNTFYVKNILTVHSDMFESINAQYFFYFLHNCCEKYVDIFIKCIFITSKLKVDLNVLTVVINIIIFTILSRRIDNCRLYVKDVCLILSFDTATFRDSIEHVYYSPRCY